MSLPVHFSISREFDPYYVYQGHVHLSQNNWLSSVRPVITNENVGKQILGTDFTRNGLKRRFIHSYLRYKNDNLFLFFDRSPLTWGQSK